MKESPFEIKGVHRNWHRGAVAVLCVNHYGLRQGQLHSIFYAIQVIYANIDSNTNFHPSEDVEELERCREQPTLLATPTSCPLIFDSVLCFNSTLGVISFTLVGNYALITKGNCQYFDILRLQEESEHLRPVQGLRLVRHQWWSNLSRNVMSMVHQNRCF